MKVELDNSIVGQGGASPPPRTQHTASERQGRNRLANWDIKYSPYLYIAPFFILFLAFGLFPICYTFWVSLQDRPILGQGEFIGLDNYVDLLQDENFWNAVYNTVGIFIISTVPQLLTALFLAHLLNRQLRARTLFRMGVLIPYVTSVAAVAIVFNLIYARDYGLVNWVLGAFGVDPIDWQAHKWSSWIAISTIVDWRWTGYNALIYLAAMQAIPRDLYESASLDGASQWRQFWSITIPMLRPTIIFTVIISTIGGLQLFTEPVMFASGGGLSGGTQRQFQTVAMYMYEQAFYRFDLGYGSAVAWALFLLILVAGVLNFLIVRRISDSSR